MPTITALLVLAAGSFLPVQPAGTPPQGQPEASAQDILDFTDSRLVPAWAVKPEDRNAAIIYLKATMDFPRETRTEVNDLNWDDVGSTTDPAKLPTAFTAASKKLREGSMLWITLCVEASKLKKYDIENGYEGGVGMLLPHLSHMRALARAMRVEARQLAVEGKRDEAARLVATMIRMSRQVPNDRVLISSLVGLAIGKVGVAEGNALLGSGGLGDAARDDLRQAIASVLTDDPYQLRAAMESERDLFLEWFRLAVVRSPKAPDAVAGLLGQQADPAVVAKIRELKGAALDAEIARAREAYDEVIRGWKSPDAQAALAGISRRVEQGDFGLIARIAMPSFNVGWKNSDQAVADLKALDARLAGEAKP